MTHTQTNRPHTSNFSDGVVAVYIREISARRQRPRARVHSAAAGRQPITGPGRPASDTMC